MSVPRLSLIVAMTENRLIGANNAMPWHLPADLAFFKATTLSHPVVMGRKTFESIGKALPGRRNIVVSRDPGYLAQGCVMATSLEQSLREAGPSSEVFVIGGGLLFEAMLPRAARIYLTQIHATLEGDTFFPALDPAEWQEVSRQHHPRDQKNAFDLTFLTLDRRPAV